MNQNHRLSRWYAQGLQGHFLAASEYVLKYLATASSSQAAAKAAFSYAFLFLLPVNGSMYSLNDI